MKQRGFFDEQDRLEELSRLGDPLERLNRVIDWEAFRPCLNRVFKKEAKGPGGRPPFDYVLMFKILILQRRERLVQADSIDTLFYRFTHQLEEAGLITRTGSIVDASFVDVPRQRNSREENEKIKKGEIPSEWEKEEYKHKRAQKDVDARWTKKNDETHFGYKNHVQIPVKFSI